MVRIVLRLLAFLVPLGVFVRTLAPSVGPNDAGELIAVAATLGVAHPTGYPLFTLLGHAWTWLPLPGTAAWQLNLFAAFCVASASVVVFEIVRLLLGVLWPDDAGGASVPAPDARDIAALAGALLFAFARTVWQQATSVEVYSLHLLLSASILWTFLRAVFRPERGPRAWLVFAFAVGLGFTNHLTVVVLAPALLFLFFRTMGWRAPARRLLVQMALPFAAALLLYAYLPLRSSGAPEFDWGGVARDLDKFLWHVRGGQYSDWVMAGVLPANVRRFFLLFPYQIGLLGVVLVPAGFWIAFRRRRDLGIFLALLFAGAAGYAFTYDIPDIDAYFLLAFVVAQLAAIVAGYRLVRQQPRSAPALMVLPLAALAVDFAPCDRSTDWTAHDFAVNMAAHFEPGALVLSGDWETFDSAFWYLQRVEGFRRDVALVNMHLLRRTWYPAQLERWYPGLLGPIADRSRALARVTEALESGGPVDGAAAEEAYTGLLNGLVEHHIARRPVYVTDAFARARRDIGRRYETVPAGFALRVLPPGSPVPPPLDRFDLDRMIAAPVPPDDDGRRAVVGDAMRGVERSSAYAARRGDRARAERLAGLVDRLRRKLQ